MIGGVASIIGSFLVRGTASADSYFAAHGFTRTPTIHGVAVNPATDPRFLKA